MQGTPRAAWRCLGFLCVFGTVSGCATAASPPRSVADEQPLAAAARATPASEERAIGDAPRAMTVSASAHDHAASSELIVRGDLPWLSPSHIGAAVRAHHSDFQACQALGDLESQREDGAVTVGWAVRANGSVKGVTLGSTTFASEGVNACVLGVAKKVTFPASAAPTQVSWTVKFRGAPLAPLADATLH